MKRYAVFGNPISRSLSPIIHQSFARQFNLQIDYQRVQVEPGTLSQAVQDFFASGGSGLNITIPHKQQAYQLAASHGASAEQAQAANTLFYRAGKLHAENTDGIGLLRDLKNLGAPELNGQSVLLLGAGGVSRAILPGLLAAQPGSLTIVNRSESKLQQLAAICQQQGMGEGIVRLHSWANAEWHKPSYSLIINAIASTQARDQQDGPSALPYPDDIIATTSVAYDINYSLQTTDFVRWAQARQAAIACDGLGMLVEQAAESFYHWHGLRPQSHQLATELRAQLRAN